MGERRTRLAAHLGKSSVREGMLLYVFLCCIPLLHLKGKILANSSRNYLCRWINHVQMTYAERVSQ